MLTANVENILVTSIGGALETGVSDKNQLIR